MNLSGNIAGISVPIIVGFIVQITGSYFIALMFFAAAGVALLICSSAIDYSRKDQCNVWSPSRRGLLLRKLRDDCSRSRWDVNPFIQHNP